MRLKHYMGLLVIWLLSSCDTSMNVDAIPDFSVTTEKATYKAGEEVEFKLSGNPGIITFYSGEIGKDYEFKEGRIVPAGVLTLSFTSSVTGGTQPNQFSVLISSNFNGKYNITDIKAATWTDITNRFTLGTSATYVNSGTADVTDLRVEGKPIYVVLRYIYDPTKGTGRSWGIRGFKLQSNTILGLQNVADQNTAGFALYYLGPKEVTGRSSITSTTITLRSNAAGNTADYTEDWCISSGFDVGSKDIGPDRPVKVKGYSDGRQNDFQYIYSKAGTYKARFVAINATEKETKSVVKELNVEIIP